MHELSPLLNSNACQQNTTLHHDGFDSSPLKRRARIGGRTGQVVGDGGIRTRSSSLIANERVQIALADGIGQHVLHPEVTVGVVVAFRWISAGVTFSQTPTAPTPPPEMVSVALSV